MLRRHCFCFFSWVFGKRLAHGFLFYSLKAEMSLSGKFSKHILRSGLMKKSISGYFGGVVARYSKIWEPDYLILGMTKTPEYDKINVQIKGYDFVVLEKFQKFIIKIAKSMKINILKAWPAPQQDLVIQHYKINSSEVKYEYNMRLSERNIQIVDVQSHIMPLFIEAVLTTCPPGVNISFHEHEEIMETERYVPNLDVKELEEKLENIEKEKEHKRKKKV